MWLSVRTGHGLSHQRYLCGSRRFRIGRSRCNCAAHIAVLIGQPNTTSAQWYSRFIDLLPRLIAWLPLPRLSNLFSYSSRNSSRLPTRYPNKVKASNDTRSLRAALCRQIRHKRRSKFNRDADDIVYGPGGATKDARSKRRANQRAALRSATMKYAEDNTTQTAPWASCHPDPGAASLAQTVLSLQSVAQIPSALTGAAISRGGVTTTINASTLKDKDYEEINRPFEPCSPSSPAPSHECVEFTAGEGGHVLHCFDPPTTRMRRL